MGEPVDMKLDSADLSELVRNVQIGNAVQDICAVVFAVGGDPLTVRVLNSGQWCAEALGFGVVDTDLDSALRYLLVKIGQAVCPPKERDDGETTETA